MIVLLNFAQSVFLGLFSLWWRGSDSKVEVCWSHLCPWKRCPIFWCFMIKNDYCVHTTREKGFLFFLLNDCVLCQLERGVRGAGWLSQYSNREKMVLVLPSDNVRWWVMCRVCVSAGCGYDHGKSKCWELCFSKASGMVSCKHPVQGSRYRFPVTGSQHPDLAGGKNKKIEWACSLCLGK